MPQNIQTVSFPVQKPNPTLTPGEWSSQREVRNVTWHEKQSVFKAYGVSFLKHLLYVIDHLIPLELNGTNGPRNVWPQRRGEAHLKDQDENSLEAEVKAGKLTLDQARMQMLEKWGNGGSGIQVQV